VVGELFKFNGKTPTAIYLEARGAAFLQMAPPA